MQTKPKISKVILLWLLKFFVPPLVGTVFLVVVYAIIYFDVFFWGYAGLPFRLSSTIKLLISNLYNFYVYYLLAYLVFFLYLIVLEKIDKLSLLIVIVSGFIYGLIPLLFDRKSSLSFLICLAIAVSGAMCAACYYYLDKKLRPLNLAKD